MMDESLEFARMWVMAAGLVLAGLTMVMFSWADRRRQADLAKLAHPRFLERLVSGWSPRLRRWRRALWLAAILLLALAAAGPRFGHEWREVKWRGIDILFAVDTSRSMLAEDLTPNRLERARLGILDFLGRLEGDRVGLIPFAGSAFALCPLTLDYSAFSESLAVVDTNLIPQQGTDLASAIREADRLFDAEGNNHRILVLITDGEDLEGEALDAAKASAELGTTIHTVGVGAADGQLIPTGAGGFLRDEGGELVRTSLDARTLERIAEVTGGLYVPLGRGAEGLDSIYERRLALAPKSELAQQMEKVPLERYQWPLSAAVFLLLLQTVMSERRRERKSAVPPSVARRIKPAVALFACLTALYPAGTRADAVTTYNAGTEAYLEGRFGEAADRLRESLVTPDLSLQQRAYYNLGNSLYRLGETKLGEDPGATVETWEQALKAFEDSFELDESDEDARYNRDLVRRRLDELKEQQQQQSDPEQNEKSGDQEDEGDGEEPGDEGDDGQEPGEQEGGEEKDDGSSGEETQQDEGAQDDGAPDGGEPGQDQDAGDEEMPGEATEADEEPPGSASEQAGEVREAGEMSREEAIRLLEALGTAERLVLPLSILEDNPERRSGRAANRKTW